MEDTKAKTQEVPMISQAQESLGEIRINHSVVASIVRLAALEVEGVYSVGGGFVDGIAEIFSKKESDRGVRVREDEVGDYLIELRVVLTFGTELAKAAILIQENVSRQVLHMTMKQVANVDVIIDGIKAPQSAASAQEDEEWDDPLKD
tara:strand:+ start:19840 stop:20283 length:444 start_codon:yes stop_codon:yes gene_type:complete